MAIATQRLIDALRNTANRLGQGATYQWTHMGACNCGHLAQTLTGIERSEIHRLALERAGDWGEQALDYCATSGLPIDHVMTTMLEAGLELRDIGDLERLRAPEVLARIPLEERPLDWRHRPHVIRYLHAWAELLEERAAAHAVETSGVHLRIAAVDALSRAS